MLYRPNVFGFDRKNKFGKHCLWAMFPSQVKAVGAPSTATGGSVSIGQRHFFNLQNVDPGFGGSFNVVSDNYGPLGAAEALRCSPIDNVGFNRLIRTDNDLGIIFPNPGSFTIMALIRPSGDGRPGGSGDPRVFSTDLGTGEADHDLMIGIANNGNSARSRIRINGTTQTVLTGAIQDDALNLIIGGVSNDDTTFDTFTALLREDGTFSRTAAGAGAAAGYTPRTTTDIAIGANAGANDNAFGGDILCICAFDTAFDDPTGNIFRDFMRDPWQVLEPRRPLFPSSAAAGGQNINVGLASETDTAQPLIGSFTVPTGLATEIDTAQPVEPSTTIDIAVGLTSETNTVQPLTGAFTVPVGLSSEVNIAQPLTGSLTVPVGQVSETNLAQPVTIIQGINVDVGQASEISLAQPLTVLSEIDISVGLVGDTSTAQPVTFLTEIDIQVGLVSESNLAQPVTLLTEIDVQAGLASEVNTAQPLTGTFTIPIGQVSETNLAQPITLVQGARVAVGQAIEINTAQLLTGDFTVPVSQAVETDIAQPLTGSLTVPVSLASEIDIAQPVTLVQGINVSVGLASEVSLAQPLTGAFTVLVGLVGETNTAQAVTFLTEIDISVGQVIESSLAQPVTLTQGTSVAVGQAIEINTAQLLTGDFTVPVNQAGEINLAQPVTLFSAQKSATVSVIGGENLSNLTYVVFNGYDMSVASILVQGGDESTDDTGKLVIDLSSTGVVQDDPVSIVISDYTALPTANNRGAVCFATVEVE